MLSLAAGDAASIAISAAPNPRSSSICTNQAPEGVPHQDRLLAKGTENLLVVVDYLGDAEARERGWVAPDSFDFSVQARPRRREDAEPTVFVVAPEQVPASRSHPRSVDEDDRIRLWSHVAFLPDR